MKLIIPLEILNLVEKKSIQLGHKKVFSFKELSFQLQEFIEYELGTVDSKLYHKYRNGRGIDERTLRFAWGQGGETGSGAITSLRDLLCLFSFNKSWRKTIEFFHLSETDIVRKTLEAKNRYSKIAQLEEAHIENLLSTRFADMLKNVMSNPSEKEVLLKLANEKFKDGKYQEVVTLLDSTLLNNEVDSLRLKNQAYRHLQKYEESIDILLHILELLPGDFQALFELGNRYYSIGNFEKSIFYHEAASAIYPNHPTIVETLKSAKKKLGFK